VLTAAATTHAQFDLCFVLQLVSFSGNVLLCSLVWIVGVALVAGLGAR
jgi:hypothetical protein